MHKVYARHIFIKEALSVLISFARLLYVGGSFAELLPMKKLILFYFAALSRIENLSHTTLETIGGADQPNHGSRPAESREPTSRIKGADQPNHGSRPDVFIHCYSYVSVLRTLHSYSRSLELGYVHKLYGEMPDTKNQCKKLRCGERTGNVYSKPMQVHLTSGV